MKNTCMSQTDLYLTNVLNKTIYIYSMKMFIKCVDSTKNSLTSILFIMIVYIILFTLK